MPAGIGATGFVGLAFETTEGTYAAPTNYWPIENENLNAIPEHIFRRLIRGIADEVGAVQGNMKIGGTINAELYDDMFTFMLYASRFSVVKSGAGPFVYTFTPTHGAVPSLKTMSVTVVRNGTEAAYTGVVLSSVSVNTEGGLAKAHYNLIGRDEADQATPVYANPTSIPYGPGAYTIEIPTAAQVFDIINFEFMVDNSGEMQHRLTNLLTPRFAKFGERAVTLRIDSDFEDRVQLDAFKAATASSVTLKLDKGVNNKVTLTLPVAVREGYEIGGLSGQGDLISESVTWRGQYDTSTSKSVNIVVTTPTLSIV